MNVDVVWKIYLGQGLFIAFAFACFIFMIERVWLLCMWLAGKTLEGGKKLWKSKNMKVY